MKIRVVVTGRSYHEADQLPDELVLADGSTVDDAVASLESGLAEGRGFPGSCLIAVSGQHLGTIGDHASHTLKDGDELVLIAPVAGG